MAEPAQRRVRYDEYLAADAESEGRIELEDGTLFAMGGGTPDHALLAANWIGELHAALRGRPCRPYSSDLRIRVAAADAAFYPDVSVICGDVRAAEDDPHAATNPTVVVEVLSPSTQARDRGSKWAAYRHLRSLRHYVLVHAALESVEVFDRNDDGTWTLRILGPGDTVPLAALDAQLPMSALYAGWQAPPSAILVQEWHAPYVAQPA